MKESDNFDYSEHLKAKSSASLKESNKRKVGTRKEKEVKEDLPKMVFSLKDFDFNTKVGQTFEEWQSKEKLLAYLMGKLQVICEKNVVEAQQLGLIKTYPSFPINSKFKCPDYISKDDVKWAVIMKVKGQKQRVVGHIIGNVFYIVFLDKDHEFYPTQKRNT